MVKFHNKFLKAFFYCSLFFAVASLFSGCATVPPREVIPTFSLNGTTYYSLAALCDSRNIKWQYDTFSHQVSLSKEAHKINFMVGDTLVLIDGSPTHFNYPIDIYQGAIVVPVRFKEEVLDTLFKEYPGRKKVLSISKIRKVVVDAGHGGNDPGAIGRTGLREDDVNLDIAKRLSNILKSEGIGVVLTRSSDQFVPLSRRVDIANDSGADLFISIHSNANRVRSLNGFEVYYVDPSVSDTKRAMLAAQEAALNLDSACFASRAHDLKVTLWDMVYTNSRAEAIEFSRALCRTINNNLDVRVLGVKGARYEVLRGVRMPAVLIETGFLSNSAEERKLRNALYRQKIAEAIAVGLSDYSRDSAIMEAAKR